MSERVVLVGYGPVGARLIEGLLPAVRDGRIDLTVIGAETHDVYNRVLLAEYAVGRADREGLDMGDRLVAEEAGVQFVLGMTVVGVDRDRQVVRLHDGIRVPYDRLVLATGARANVPTLAGLERAQRHRAARPGVPAELDRGSAPLPRGVVALRDLADAEHVRAAVSAGQRIVVLGAGVLGMELALAAAEAGAEVVVAYHSAAPMNRTLDENGGRVLAAAATAVGVEMMHHARAESIVQRYDDHGQAWFDGLVCADGKVLAGDLLVLSCGVAARTEVASLAGLATSTGVLVDGASRSWTDPHVFAIGDCAHVADPADAGDDGRVPGGPSGLVGPGWRQADRLAALLTAGDDSAAASASPAPVPGAAASASPALAAGAAASASPALAAGAAASVAPVPVERPGVVMLKAEGIDVVAGGAVDADPFAPVHAAACHAPQVTLWADPARGAYVKLVTVDGVLTGFVSVGMPRTGAELTLLFERGSELPADRSSLLRLDAPDAGMAVVADPFAADATVCWCNGVSAGAIRDAVAAGEPTVACVKASTRAGTGCGGCVGRISELLAREAVPA
ncbi:FAD-dependent oxidoreductase [Microbacterium enclense]|uniref:FAD-dependent oxidoreductase n=1 Tax=Microbacterium enclense TaxID=993073 RepID=UPI003417C234